MKPAPAHALPPALAYLRLARIEGVNHLLESGVGQILKSIDLNHQLHQNIEIGLSSDPDGKIIPAVRVSFKSTSTPKAPIEGLPVAIEVAATYEALFRAFDGLSKEQCVEYVTSTAAAALALQAFPLAATYFRSDLRAMGLNVDGSAFNPPMDFGKQQTAGAGATLPVSVPLEEPRRHRRKTKPQAK